LSYGTPIPIGGTLSNGNKVSLGYSLTYSGEEAKHIYSEQPSLSLTSSSPLSEDEIIQQFVHPLRNLMTFVCQKPQAIEELKLWREDSHLSGSKRTEVQLITSQIGLVPSSTDRSSVNLLFRFEDVSHDFSSFLEAWLEISGRYSECFSVFFDLMYEPPAFLDLAFLGAVQAIRFYYLYRPEVEAGIQNDNLRVESILQVLPTSDAQWLRERLSMVSSPILKEILGTLIAEHREIMIEVLPFGADQFVEEVCTTVEYHLHRSESLAESATHGVSLHWHTIRLTQLTKLCILKEMGFTSEVIQKLFKSNSIHAQLRKS